MTSQPPQQAEGQTPAGGFVGDPSEAFSPPAGGGCCGTASSTPVESEQVAVSPCCGMAEPADAAGSCCG